MKPIFRWSAVRVAARSVKGAESPSRRHILRTSPAPRESWETKSTLPSTSPRVTGLATSWSAAARRRPATRARPTRAPSLFSSSSRCTPRTTSRVCSKVSRWWYGLCSMPLERESSGTAATSPPSSSGGSSASRRPKGLPPAAGLLAAGVRVGTAPQRTGLSLRVLARGLLGLAPPAHLGHAPPAAPLDESVDEGKDDEEEDGVH